MLKQNDDGKESVWAGGEANGKVHTASTCISRGSRKFGRFHFVIQWEPCVCFLFHTCHEPFCSYCALYLEC